MGFHKFEREWPVDVKTWKVQHDRFGVDHAQRIV